jgi:hypothetical protein
MLAASAASAVAACAPKVSTLADDNPIRQRSGASHTVSMSVLQMGNPDAGYRRAFKAALSTCDLPYDTNASDIRFERGLALYDRRFYAFECPEPGKDTQ